MKPSSLSATALHVFEQCPARYKAEQIDRSRGFGSSAATLGSTVHLSLEMFVKQAVMDTKMEPTLEFIQECFKMAYVTTFGTTNYETVEFNEGMDMAQNWYKRNFIDKRYFDTATVISSEVKTHFMVPTSIGEIPFNYIWDRFDDLGNGEFKVVDYKSNRWSIQPSDLLKKIQARAYGLAAAIQLKAQNIEYKKIWVEFDMLRHGPVGVVFTYEDNLAFWNYLIRQTEEIINMPDDEVIEKLNSECLFCVRKSACEALRKNIMVGGIHSIASVEDAIDLRAALEWQRKGLESLIKDIDVKILAEAKERDQEEFESADNRLKIGVSRTRKIDPDMAEMAIGPDLFNKYGGKRLTMAAVDKLLKGKELSTEQKAQLRSLIYFDTGEPRVRIETKNPIDEEP